ncbi:hypothetical protein BASA84_000132 [Batrachochytrium salamandrivorans]|nr:hypothetical protein BASA81_014675 [Batrachochytrium salamandrivorans]KAH9268527.1 hypothetical protein BASA84_000132 [Batrachochytrium salamandrivorans]
MQQQPHRLQSTPDAPELILNTSAATATMAFSSASTDSSYRIGDFAIGTEIGRGSFATVYKAVHLPSATSVAIKSVSRAKLNRKLAENLETEIRILREIHHPNIVQLLDILKTDTDIHLVMEYCSLGDLSIFIKKKGMVGPLLHSSRSTLHFNGPWGGLHETVIRHFLAQLVTALEFMRSKSLIHRDLKPQNLLLSPAGPGRPDVKLKSSRPNIPAIVVPALPILKLADFGFARALPAQSMASTLCGSPLYMAPEILRGDRYDAKADLWSLGGILYEMITGHPPFSAQNHIELLRKIESRSGWIRFPGEAPDERKTPSTREFTGQLRQQQLLNLQPTPLQMQHQSQRQQPFSHQSQYTQQQPGYRKSMTQLASSPNSPSTALHVGSLGSSPKYANFTKVRDFPSVPDDLKDLVRHLLKRNPIERMTFEELFVHPSVALVSISELRFSATPMPSTTTGFTPTLPSHPDGPLHFGPSGSGLKRLPSRSSQLHLLQQASPLQQQHSHHSPPSNQQPIPHPSQQLQPLPISHSPVDIRLQPKVGIRRSTSFQTHSSHSPVSPSPLNPMSSLPRDESMYSRPSHRASMDSIPVPSSSAFGKGIAVAASAPLTQSPLIRPASTRILDPPFAEYGSHMHILEKQTPSEPRSRLPPTMERHMSVPVSHSSVPLASLDTSQPSLLARHSHSKPHVPQPSLLPQPTPVGEETQSHGATAKLSASRSQSSFGSSVGSFVFSDDGDDGDDKKNLTSHLNRVSITPDRALTEGPRDVSGHRKEEKPDVMSKPIDDDSRGLPLGDQTADTISPGENAPACEPADSDDHKSHEPGPMQESEEYVVVEKGVVEVNWLADQVASQAQRTREAHSIGSVDKNTAISNPILDALSGRLGDSALARSKALPPQRSTLEHFVAATKALASLGSNSSQLGLVMGDTGQPSNPIPVGGHGHSGDVRMQRASSDTPRTRIFGSLRSLNNMSEIQGSGSSVDAKSPVQPHSDAQYRELPYMTHLETSALDEHQSNFFSTLNLCALRAHAVNTLADGYFAELERVFGAGSSMPSAEKNATLTSASDGGDANTGKRSNRFNPITLPDETLALYVHALGLYQYGMELAKRMWDQEQERDCPSQSILISRFGFGSPKRNACAVSTNMLGNLSVVVQWIRDRFNTCLERADQARGFILAEEMSVDAVPLASSGGLAVVGSVPLPETAEKLIYDHALQISQIAALQELHHHDLDSCEAAYQQAILLLESLLHTPPRSPSPPLSAPPPPPPPPVPISTVYSHSVESPSQAVDPPSEPDLGDELTDEDRVVIEKFLLGLYTRLNTIQGRVRSN